MGLLNAIGKQLQLADLEAAFRDAGFVESRTERNDAVRFGSHCMLGRKPAAN